MGTEIFLDTSFAIAPSSSKDRHHVQAIGIADRLHADRNPLITTRAVCLEIGNSLAKQRFRSAARQLLTSLESDSNVTIEPLTEELFADGLKLFQSRSDKDWGLTDCISFVVMQNRGIIDALTADKHFQQVGFRALLLESSV